MKFLAPKEYQANCIDRFEYYKIKVIELLPNARVEHIGASAIPNAISKGDLDIFVGVEKIELEWSVEILRKLDFHEKQDTLRTHELCMMESMEQDVAFQVVANDSKFENFILFRDKLKEDSKLVEEYNQIKRNCEGLCQNKYRELKSEFIERTLTTR